MHARHSPVILAFALALTIPVEAAHCETYSTSEADVTIPGVAGERTRYAFYEGCGPCDWPDLHVYEESNGLPGLQRADIFADDTCHGMVPSDFLWWY